jgi:hypothetical protein
LSGPGDDAAAAGEDPAGGEAAAAVIAERIGIGSDIARDSRI